MWTPSRHHRFTLSETDPKPQTLKYFPQTHSTLSLPSFRLMFLQTSICSHQNPGVFHASSFSLMSPHFQYVRKPYWLCFQTCIDISHILPFLSAAAGSFLWLACSDYHCLNLSPPSSLGSSAIFSIRSLVKYVTLMLLYFLSLITHIIFLDIIWFAFHYAVSCLAQHSAHSTKSIILICLVLWFITTHNIQ